MYNNDLKQRFITEEQQNGRYMFGFIAFFRHCEAFEVELDADIYTFNAEQLTRVLNGRTNTRKSGLVTDISLVRRYVKWCLANGIEGVSDASLSLTTKEVDNMRKCTVKSPEDLNDYLEKVFAPVYQNTSDDVLRGFLWLAFSGVMEEDAVCLTTDCVDFDSMLIRYNGQEYPIYKQSIGALSNCVHNTRFAFHHPNYVSTAYRQRSDSNYLLRKTLKGGDDPDVDKRIGILSSDCARKSAQARKNGLIDRKITYGRTRLSGIFYRVYMHELKGFTYDFMELVEEDFKRMEAEGRTYNLSSGRNTMDAKKRQLARQYEDDYTRWKLTLD